MVSLWRQALIHGLQRHYYSIVIDYRKNELEEQVSEGGHMGKGAGGGGQGTKQLAADLLLHGVAHNIVALHAARAGFTPKRFFVFFTLALLLCFFNFSRRLHRCCAVQSARFSKGMG